MLRKEAHSAQRKLAAGAAVLRRVRYCVHFCAMGDRIPCVTESSSGRRAHSAQKKLAAGAAVLWRIRISHGRRLLPTRRPIPPLPRLPCFSYFSYRGFHPHFRPYFLFNTAFLTPFSHLPHFYLQKYPKPRIINFMFCFVTKIKCETEVKIRRCWEWDAGFGWTQRKRKGNAYE